MEKNTIKTTTAIVGGKTTNYWQRNARSSSHVVLVMHGFMSDLRSMQPFVADLDIPSDTRILLPDLPGFGESEPLAGTSIDEYVQWAADFLKTVAPRAKRITIVGYSFGAYIAVKVAARGDLPLEKLVLITPVVKIALPVRVYSNGFDLLAALSMQAAHKLYVWPPSFDFTTYYLSKTKDKSLREKLRHYRRQELDALRPELVMALYRNLAEIDLMAYAERLRVPVLVVMAEKDNVAHNPYTHNFMHDIESRVVEVTINDAGHLLPFEEPMRLAEVINRHGIS